MTYSYAPLRDERFLEEADYRFDALVDNEPKLRRLGHLNDKNSTSGSEQPASQQEGRVHCE